MDTTPFDPSKLRLGVAGQLSETHVAPAQAAGDDGYDPAYRAKATEAAVKFESFFIGHMLHQMRSGTRELAGDDSPYKDKVNEDMLDLADNMVADKMAGQRAFGIADAILRQLLPPTNTASSVNTAISADRVAPDRVAPDRVAPDRVAARAATPTPAATQAAVSSVQQNSAE